MMTRFTIAFLLGIGLLHGQYVSAKFNEGAPNTPTDSPGAGTYSSTQSVTLSDPNALSILYTTDGSTPACPATGTLYTGAISISVTTTLKAIGCNGVTGGGVLTSVYTISGAACTPRSGYIHCRTLTIDHTQVPNTDQTNFPVLISKTDTAFKTVGNGGNIQNTVSCCASAVTAPADMVFTSDSAGTTLVAGWEFRIYVPTTGQIIVNINIGTVKTASDTVFYMSYDNSGVTTYQCTPSATWDSAYVIVQHLGDGTTLQLLDSTSVGNNGTNNGGTTATSGLVDGAGNFVGSSSQSITVTSTSFPSGSSDRTMSIWVYKTSTSVDVAFSYGTATANQAFGFYINNLRINVFLFTNDIDTGVDIALNTWTKIDISVGSSGASIKTYKNGALVNTNTTSTVNTVLNLAALGKNGTSPLTNNPWNGKLQEADLSNVVRSADWLVTRYNEQVNTTTFITLGTEI